MMHSKIRRQTVDLGEQPARPSRIRRDPVPVQSEAEVRKALAKARERQMWGAVAGVVLFAVSIAVVTVGIGIATDSGSGATASAAQEQQFRQCYSAGAADCVLDGDTIRVGGQLVDIAGIQAPEITGAACREERSRGIKAAVRLADLLNSGEVAVSSPVRDRFGRTVRAVEVNGRDVAGRMIAASVARKASGHKQNWC